jgi:sulfatase maturation enzyme AslB (radical SAM superfamily)
MISQFALKPKRDKQQEYTIHLFEFCNLSCSFCWQNHGNIVGLDTVLDKLDPIEKFLKSEKKSKVVFNIMGGEIFADEIYNDKLNNDYIELARGISRLGEKYNIETAINWVTNLVTSKIPEIEHLLSETAKFGVPSTLFTSYDPAGRFNKKNLEIYKKNLYYFKDKLDGIGILLTRPNINRWLQDKDPFLKELYDAGFYIYADYYMPDKTAMFQAPSDLDMYNVFKLFIDHYPKIDPIRSWIEHDKNYISCRSSKLVLEDGTMCMCGNLVQSPVDKEMYISDIKPMDNTPIEEKFVNKYNCLTCEFFDRCTLGCFMAHDYKHREEVLDECVYKLAHRYIKDAKLQQSTKLIDVVELHV